MKEDGCQELKNINFKSMLLSGNNHKINNTELHNNEGVIDNFLEQDLQANKKEPWVKLNNTMKLKKIVQYIKTYITENKELNLTLLEIETLRKYLIECIDKKRLSKVKDIIYDKELGIIKVIPGLEFNKTTRKFTLVSSDKKTSTLRSLAPKNTQKATRKQKSVKPDVKPDVKVKDKVKDNNKIDKS